MGHSRNSIGNSTSQVGAPAATRLAPHDRADGLITRDGLRDKLDDVLAHRLTVVHAGAGYGKTSLLMQWYAEVRARNIAAAWLTLEEEEASAATCLSHIIAALVRVGYLGRDPAATVTGFGARASQALPVSAFVNALMDAGTEVVLFLDEYNRAGSEETDALFKTLVRALPQHVHFVLAGRQRPDLDLENLRARGDLLEVTARDLRFTSEEANALLSASGAMLDGHELHRLLDRTEGWPIAVQMARLWLGGDPSRARLVSDFSGRTMDLARYLAEQVFANLSTEAQTFLMRTSVADRINGDLANALTARRDGWLVLENLHDGDLFVMPESEDRQWFRYHALFRDFLLDRLTRMLPDEVPTLHLRAAQWLARNGSVKAAVHHALAAGDQGLAARLLEEAGGWRLIMDGRIGLLRAGLAGLSDATVVQHPALALGKAFLIVKDGDVRGGLDWFRTLDPALFEAEKARTDYAVVDRILREYADQPASLDDLESIHDLRMRVPRTDHVVHAILADSQAAKYYEFGLFDRCLDACDDAIGRYRILNSLYGEVFLRFTRAKALSARGRLEDAEAILRQTEKELELRFGAGGDLSAQTAIYLAEVLAVRGAFDEAAGYLDAALPVVEQSDGWYELFAAAYTAAAAVGWARTGLDAALAVFDRAREQARARGLDRLLLFADCGSVRYFCLAGYPDRAATLLPRLEAALTATLSEPSHRIAAVVATSLALYQMVSGRRAEADGIIDGAIGSVTESGDLQRLVELTLLRADIQASEGRAEAAAELLDRAVHDSVFTGFLLPWLEQGRRLKLLIEEVARSGCGLPPDRYRDRFLSDLRKRLKDDEKRDVDTGANLSVAEMEVLQNLNHGLSNKEIALQLGISPNTVKFRMKGVFAKLGVSVRADAVRQARERGLV